jgi:uncharacterized protein YprB with RNaseH-like and TPR domain
LISLDIETYSPYGFPEKKDDPVVSLTLAISETSRIQNGLMVVSILVPPEKERELLVTTKKIFSKLPEGTLTTYYGSRFDIPYLQFRGNVHGVNLREVEMRLTHIDAYDIARRFAFSSYSQKRVEAELGIDRTVTSVDGNVYHYAYERFQSRGELDCLLYNIEDGVGVLMLLNKLLSMEAKL